MRSARPLGSLQNISFIRRTPEHLVVSSSSETIVFLTVCTEKRKAILSNQEAIRVLINSWNSAAECLVGRYVIMPDHVHLFCAPAKPDHLPLNRWVIFWKSQTTKCWPYPDDRPLWQRSYWDTTLRCRDHYASKWEYVRNNPVRSALCLRPEDWPFQGELNSFFWRN